MSRIGLAVGLATTIVVVSGMTAIGHALRKAPARAAAAAPVEVGEPRGPAPVVIAAGAKDVRLTDEPQLIRVTGSGFGKGVTATLIAPLGLSTTYATSSLRDLTTTSFTLSTVLDEPGTYTLTVRSESGIRSNGVPITVKPKK